MARDFNGSNQYGQVARDYSAYSTLAVGGWVSFDTLAGGGSYNMIWEHTADGGANNGGFGLYYQGTNILAVAMCGNVGMNFGYASLTPSTATWHHILALYDFTKSGNEVDLYYDGTLQSLTRSVNNDNSNTNKFANSTLNFGIRNGSSLPFDGKLERIFVASADPGAGIAAAIYRGADPRVALAGSIIDYWPLPGIDSPEPNWMSGGTAITLTNTPARANGAPASLWTRPKPSVFAGTSPPPPANNNYFLPLLGVGD